MDNEQVWKQQLKALRELKDTVFPKMEIAIDAEGYLALCLNADIVNEWDLWDEYGEIASIDRI